MNKNKPEIKKHDQVRFLPEREIKKLNKDGYGDIKISPISTLWNVIEVNNQCNLTIRSTDGYIIMTASALELEICNDFSDIAVGDEVEMSDGTTEKVLSVGRDIFYISQKGYGDRYGLLKRNGYHQEWYAGVHAVRIVKKATQPLLANAQKGDPCRRRDGKWVQYESSGLRCGQPVHTIGGTVYLPNGQIMPKTQLGEDIVEVQSLAPEGTKEWAWQMMLLGHKCHNKDIHNAWYCIDNDQIKEHTNGTDKQSGFMSVKSWIEIARKTGWQLYEPEKTTFRDIDPKSMSITDLAYIVGNVLFNLAGKGSEPSSHTLEGVEDRIKQMLDEISTDKPKPKPRFEVGQYVANKTGLYAVIVSQPDDVYSEYMCNFLIPELGCEWYAENELVPVPAKDVVISIGCMSGKVRRSNKFPDKAFILKGLIDNEDAIISFAMLSDPMYSIVKALLTRQKKEVV